MSWSGPGPMPAKNKPWTREDYIREFQALTARMLEITTKKNHDYGGHTDPFKNFRDFGELGVLVRMSDKFARLRTAIAEKREFAVSDESVEDTCLDLANYALLLLCYRQGA
jgi:Nucleotide modification associated domain 1